jgi:exodeoxyribonuclease VII large subunit
MDDVLTVTGFTVLLRDHVWRRFASLRVRGEVSQFQVARSGHWYFTIADAGAVLSCMMFADKTRFARQQPKVGEEIVLEGHIDVYAKTGRYNLVVRSLELGGAGRLQRQLDALREQLRAEGLFEQARKRPLPRFPRGIAVVTSPTGAAFHDILEVTGKRFPAIPILLSPCKVQGEWAEKTIAQAISRVAFHGGADVLIVARGGGSQEDLSAFNDEAVVRAIANSPVPVVSAVGHETDVTIADLVADVRAATPSQAAELVVPDRQALSRMVRGHSLHLGQSMRAQVSNRRRRLGRIVLRDPKSTVKLGRERLVRLEVRLASAIANRKTRSRALLSAHAGRLDALSPLAVLGRGYAVALKEGRAVRSASELAVGDALELRLSDGSAEVTVDGLKPRVSA